VARTDSEANRLCQGDSVAEGGQEMLTDAGALLEAGISLAQSAFAEFLREVRWETSSPDCLVCHQVGRTHQRKMLEALGLDPERDFVTFPDHGNMGSVSLPYTLHRAIEAGRIDAGKRAALLGIGSGLSTVMLGVEREGRGA
jgi:3-oxoacyl-[acyl-carrier-protein] synthase-3